MRAYKPKAYLKRKKSKSRVIRKTTIPKPLKKYIRNQIHRNAENKVYVQYGAKNTITSLSTGTNPNQIYLLPQLTQGTGQSQRIGNEIKIQSGRIHGYVCCLPNSATATFQPTIVKMWLLSYKVYNQFTPLTTSQMANFFEVGNSNGSWQCNLLDTQFPINKDDWTVYVTKQFEIGLGGASTAFNTAVGAYDNSRIVHKFSFSYGKHFKQSLKYTDSASNVPTNRNLFLLIQAVRADGSYSTGDSPCSITYVNDVVYEDM